MSVENILSLAKFHSYDGGVLGIGESFLEIVGFLRGLHLLVQEALF